MTTLVKRINPNFPSFFGRDFDVLFNEALPKNTYNSLPAVNVLENEDNFKIEVAAPGLKKENFKVNVDANQLTISAKQENTTEESTEKYTRKEFSFTNFQRVFTLPQTVAGDKIEATYTDGILTLTLPKKEEAKPKPAFEVAIG